MANMKKCEEILTWLKHKNHDIIFLQGMHCCKSKETVWHKFWENRIGFCHGIYQIKGVAILFSKCFDSQKLKNIFQDKNGHFIFLALDINSVSVSCVIYMLLMFIT